MKNKKINILIKLLSGIYWGVIVNLTIIYLKLFYKRTKIIICIMNTESQLMHMESLLYKLTQNREFNFKFIYLVNPEQIELIDEHVKGTSIDGKAFTLFASAFILIYDIVLSVVQSAHFPKIKSGCRICMFHGQPTKGNTYKNSFKHKEIDAFFMYGDMMKTYYLRERDKHPNWRRTVDIYNIGQPKTDSMFNQKIDMKYIMDKYHIQSDKTTVLYAPAFEYCSSLMENGDEIIGALQKLKIQLIIKPHPAIYNQTPENQIWLDKLTQYDHEYSNITFCKDVNSAELMHVIDILLTDYSGIAFDAILLDKPVIYWHSELYFEEYLPQTSQITGKEALGQVHINAGRDSGIVVYNTEELKEAIHKFSGNPEFKQEIRNEIKSQLLYNRGNSSRIAAETIIKIIKKGK